MAFRKIAILALALGIAAVPHGALANDRARDLGIPFKGETGPLNTITDVAGVEVGHSTIVKGNGKLVRGKGPVRTGVTAIHPRGKDSTSPVFGAWFTLNASGEMTGTTWLEERGLIDGPILITNTHSVGIVRDAAVEWMVNKGWAASWHAPVVAETHDGSLNDVSGFHVKKKHALRALETASGGAVAEGNVGGGTGMICHRFKGGIGAASRVVRTETSSYTVGVLVQCNYGARSELQQIAGVPADVLRSYPGPCYENADWRPKNTHKYPLCNAEYEHSSDHGSDGSIIVVVATDAPLLPHQLKRLAKRPAIGMGRLGAVGADGSGDIFVAFSTTHNNSITEDGYSDGIVMYPNNNLTVLFEATAQATEEAIVNAMVAAETMVGANGLRVPELPVSALKTLNPHKQQAN